MASQGLRPPQFSEDVAWLPCWLQNLRTDGSNEFLKESQPPSNQEAKDLAPSQENDGDGKFISTLSREECEFKSCHLFLSAEDCSPVSFALPENVLHFSLRLSSGVDSLIFPTQDLLAFHDVVSPNKICSLRPVQTSVSFRENVHSVTDHLANEQNLLPAFIPKTVKKDASRSLIDTIGSVRQQKEKSDVKCTTSDISNAVELSVAASEALVIHDLVKMDSVSETMHTEDLLEVALRLKQARLEMLDDGFHSSSEDSDCSDSLSDLNDFVMEDAYVDIGWISGVSIEEHLCNSVISQAKGVPCAENNIRYNQKHSDKELTSQLANFRKSEEIKLEVNVEMEVQQKTDSPLDSLCCDREMHSDAPGLGSNTPKHLENGLTINNPDALALNQKVGLDMVDLTSIKLQNVVTSSAVENSGNFEKENPDAHLASERFRSRQLGGWTSKELDPSSLNQNNADWIPKFHIRETSFLTESVDIVPDESSCVLKHDTKCKSGYQLSMRSDCLRNKPDDGILHSQDVVRCSSLSVIDPLCSVVSCSISSEYAVSNADIDKEHNAENFVPFISEFEAENSQRISDENATFDCSDEQITPVLDSKDIPISATKVAKQMLKLTRVEHIGQKRMNSLKNYSITLPNQALNLNCNSTPLLTNRSMGGGASLGTRMSESLSASRCEHGNEDEQNHGYFVDHKPFIEITDNKTSDGLTIKASDANGILDEPTQERSSPLVLNNKICHSLLGPKTVVNDIRTDLQYQQNNNINMLQVECNKYHGENVGIRKKVRFLEKVEELHPKRKLSKLEPSYKRCSSIRTKRQRVSKSLTASEFPLKDPLTKYCRRFVNEFIFQGTEFLLTGLSSQKERDMEALIRKSGGVILFDIPSPPYSRGKRSSALSRLRLPIILCMRKMRTTKFLYGCAVGALILKVDWLADCLASGIILRPEKYMILPNRNDMKWTRHGKAVHFRDQKPIFERVGIMLHGKHGFCIKLENIIKHGGGQVFRTLQRLVRSTDEQRILVAAIVAEDNSTISRHLKCCALEGGIPIMPYSWIVKSLYSGKLLPFTKEDHTSTSLFDRVPNTTDMSEEI